MTEPTTVPPAGLVKQPPPKIRFGGDPPDHTAAIPPPPPRPARTAPPPPPPTAAPPATAVSEQPRTAPAARRPPATAPPATKRGPKGKKKPDRTGVQLSYALYLRLNEYWRTRDSESTYSNIMLDAILAQYRAKRLDALIADSQPTTGARSDELFVGRLLLRRSHDGPTRTVTFRPGAADLEKVDELVSTYGAVNRSHFIEAALEAFLNTKMGRPDEGG